MNAQTYLLHKRIAEEATTVDLLVLSYPTKDKIESIRDKLLTLRGDRRETYR